MASRLAAGLGLAKWQEWMASYASGRLLDLGCGKVPFFEVYRPYVDDNVCVDWAGSIHGNQYADRLCDLSDALPFSGGEFDTVVLSQVLEHVPHPESLLEEIARVMSPGGHLLLSVPFLYWVHEAPYDYTRFTEFALRRYCADLGLDVVEFESLGGAPELLLDVTSKVAMRVPVVGKAITASMQWIGTRMVRHWPLAVVSRRTSTVFPLGYMLVARKG